jgi:hypothetical protein
LLFKKSFIILEILKVNDIPVKKIKSNLLSYFIAIMVFWNHTTDAWSSFIGSQILNPNIIFGKIKNTLFTKKELNFCSKFDSDFKSLIMNKFWKYTLRFFISENTYINSESDIKESYIIVFKRTRNNSSIKNEIITLMKLNLNLEWK